jgi:flagellar hook-basal body complex protein FliE
VAAETRDEVAAVEGDDDSDDDDDDRPGGGPENAVTGLANALDAVTEAARRAAAAAEAGERGQADQRLETVIERLQRVSTRLAAASDSLPDPVARATSNRLDQAQRRSDQAKNADKL